MIVPSYRTWTAGEIVTAAYFNSNIRDSGNFLIAVPFAELRATTVQSVVASTFVAIGMDASDVDTDGGHSNVTNNSRYTGKTAGWFQVSGGVGFIANAAGQRGCQWAKNGTAINGSGGFMPFSASTGSFPAWVIPRTKHVQLNGSTDYVELQGFQTSGGALNTDVAGSGQSSMTVRWIHS
jgi:hypothetical protein